MKSLKGRTSAIVAALGITLLAGGIAHADPPRDHWNHDNHWDHGRHLGDYKNDHRWDKNHNFDHNDRNKWNRDHDHDWDKNHNHDHNWHDHH